MKLKQSDVMPLLLVAGGGLVIYFMYKTGKSLTDLFGITQSKEEKKAQELFTLYWKGNCIDMPSFRS